MGSLPRVGAPVALANAILRAALGAASLIHGAVIAVAGGWTAQV